MIKHSVSLGSCFFYLMASDALFRIFFFYVILFDVLIQHCSATESTDCLENNSVNSSITDGTSTNNLVSLVSPGRIFELGFFTPDGNAENQRYLGIWYYNSKPKIIVWVANRDNPLLASNGSLIIEHGNAKLLDGKGFARWSTNNGSMPSPNELIHFSYPSANVQQKTTTILYGQASKKKPNITTSTANATVVDSKLCLLDSGNLVLYDRQDQRKGNLYSWQSFQHPTNTFLPAMNAIISDTMTSFNLTSWQDYNNPAQGNFTFELQPGPVNELVIVETGHSRYWESTTTAFDNNALELSNMLSDPNNSTLLQNGRLVMNFTGQIQFWKWESSERSWFLIWSVPKDRCSLYNKCGNFASCNSNNGLLCKCLPGFKPSTRWEAGDTSGGCIPISGSPNSRLDSLNDIFVQLPLMAVGNKTCTVLFNEENCTAGCLNDPNCVAYSYGSDCSMAGNDTLTDKREKRCLTWNTALDYLQENSPNGISLFVRTRISDIEPIQGGCYPCGAYVVPYPLSTGRNCGDPSYLNFHCDSQIGQLNFSTSSGNFKVTSIDPINRNFSIQVNPANSCDSIFINNNVLSDKYSSSFTFRNCNVFRNIPLLQVEHPFIEVEIGWKPPLGPPCNVTSDCNPWPHTTCKTGHGHQMRCICASKFHWDGVNMKCTRVHFPLKVVVSCIAGVLVILLACCVLFDYHKRKRRMIEKQGSSEFSKDDTEGMDVPYFDWEIILAATNNFADANKLGVGGFGSVYRGKLSDGQEIAVKRLSSVSVQGAEEFRTEVKLIAKLQHRNLVRLVGYCMKASEKILVYEYMPNGSLDSCLYDEKHYVELDWKKRNDIILGIARGLLYLHQDSRLRIIHRDLKPSNILLDEELNPKISDFGIAKIVGGKETEASTGRIVGTYGYMSPEYASDGIFSVKSDVFSFGVVVLETISGKRNSRIFMIEYGLSLLGHAWKLWNDGRGMELMDPKLNESCSPSEVLKCIHIGLLCVQEDPSDRPTMSTVVHMLSGENASLPLAKQPAFMNRKPLSDTASSSSTKDMITISTVGR